MNPCYAPGVARDAAGSRLEQTARAAWPGAARGGLTDPVDVRDPETVALAKLFRTFAAGVAQDHGAFRYQRICEAVAGDEELLSLVSLAPPNQRRPNILLAAVHFLLLGGADHALAGWYPTVLAWRTEDPLGRAGGGARGHRAGDDEERRGDLSGLAAAFADFCRRHRPELEVLVATRATQTNEVGPGRARRPLAILDLGASAGLNLLFDRYAYVYRAASPGGRESEGGAGTGAGPPAAPVAGRVAGDARSPVVLSCELRGASAVADTIPLSLPDVAARAGIDRSPVDLRDEESARWLLACQWPDDVDRFRQARAAIALARCSEDAPRVERGDLVDDLGRVVATVPADAHLCVVHSWVAAYLTPSEQRALADVVASVGARRPVSWLFAEAPREAPALPMPQPSRPGAAAPEWTAPAKGSTALVLVEHRPGHVPSVERLADMHSHGRWLAWYG